MRLLLVFLAVIVLAEGHVAYCGLPHLYCKMCQKLAGYLKGKHEGGVDDVRKLAIGFCERSAPFFRNKCKRLVANKMGAIVALLKDKVDPTKICTIIKTCKN